MENAASLWSRPGLSPAATSSAPAISGDLRSDPAQLPQPGCCLGGQAVQFGVQSGHFRIQRRTSLAQHTQGQLGGGHRGQDRARLEARGRADQPAGGQAPQLLAELGRSGDHQGPQGVDGLATGLDRGGSGHPQTPHHLHQVAAGLGDRGDLPGQHRSSRRLGIHRVRLAPPPAGGAVGPIDLQDQLALGTEKARQTGAIAAAALDPERLDLTKPAGPIQQGAIAAECGGVAPL